MNRNVRLAAFAALILILAAVLLATPAGSVFANQILQFFTRGQGNTLPLPTDQIFAPVPSSTPQPTHALALQPAGQVTPVATATPLPTPELDPKTFEDLSLVAAETAAGFDLYEPLRLPRDYRLTRIFYDAARRAVTMQYASPRAGTGEFFQITQGKNLEMPEVAPEAAVEAVTVGDHPAELVRGGWFVANGDTQKTWESGSETYTLRWRVEDVSISAEFFLNERFSPVYLEREEMLALGAALARCAPPDASACRIEQAAAAVGFIPWQFPTDPAGLALHQVDYRPGTISLRYGGDVLALLTLSQSDHDFATHEKVKWSGAVPPGAPHSVTVAGQPGEYVRGQFVARPGESEATWDADAPVARLRWKNGASWFQIIAIGKLALEPPEQLVALAAQVSDQPAAANAQTGVQPQATPESNRTGMDLFTSVADLEARAGYDVLEPAVLPEGLAFSHARYEPLFGTVMLFYGNFAPDKMHADGPVLTIGQTPRVGLLSYASGYYPPESLQPVEVNGHPGQLFTGSMETFMAEPGQPTPAPVWHPDSGALVLDWEAGDMTYSISFHDSGQGARLSAADLLKIAESLR